MLTLNNRVASFAAASPVRVPVAASRKPLFSRFLAVLLQALGAMHA
jgi:hypothetical protein